MARLCIEGRKLKTGHLPDYSLSFSVGGGGDAHDIRNYSDRFVFRGEGAASARHLLQSGEEEKPIRTEKGNQCWQGWLLGKNGIFFFELMCSCGGGKRESRASQGTEERGECNSRIFAKGTQSVICRR